MAFLLARVARAFQISLLTLIRIQSFYLMSATHQLCRTKLNSNKMTGGLAERPGFKYMEARFGRPDFEVWKILVAVVMIEVI